MQISVVLEKHFTKAEQKRKKKCFTGQVACLWSAIMRKYSPRWKCLCLTRLSSATKHSISHVNKNLLIQSLTLKEKSQVISQRIDIYTVWHEWGRDCCYCNNSVTAEAQVWWWSALWLSLLLVDSAVIILFFFCLKQKELCKARE